MEVKSEHRDLRRHILARPESATEGTVAVDCVAKMARPIFFPRCNRSHAPPTEGRPAMIAIEDFLSKLKRVNKNSNGWEAYCPGHQETKASLTVSTGEDGRILLHCFAGCSAESIVSALGLKMADLFPDRPPPERAARGRIVAIYDYTDESGKLLFQSVRYEPKDFKQRRPDPSRPGKWIWNLKGVRRVLYGLPEVTAAIAAGPTIYIVAGEKDVSAMVQHGFAATCNPLGEKKDGSSWLPEYTETLRNAASVIVIADKDETGRAHARVIATALRPVVSNLKLVELPDRDAVKVKDAADFFAAGGSADELRVITEAAPEFVPALEPPAAIPDSAASEYIGRDDEPESDEREEQKPRKKSAATLLVRLADEFSFFHDPQSRAFVRLDVNGHVEVWPVNSTQFRNLMAQTFYRRTGTAINRNALADAIATLAGRACYDCPEEPVFLRVAYHRDNILIDLCDPQWRVIEVTPAGWRVLEKSPVAFIRTGAMRPLPLPAPAAGGSLNPLWDLLNVTAAQRPLVAGALLNYFHPHGPFFVTNFVGEQGTAKSCAAKILRLLVDPNETPLRSPPRTEQDLLVQAGSNRCVALDNLSSLPPWLSDSLCRLSTGGGHSARSLYTDAEEFTLSVKRPVILNGIEDVATRPDLAERALQIELETIPEEHRMSERELWRKFESARPGIFSAILDGVACALRELPNLKLQSRPRMADPLEWATAGEPVFGWEQGTFEAAYSKNLSEGAIASVDAHPVGLAIRQLLEHKPEWSGEPAQLLTALNDSVADELRHARNWPQNPRALSACLRRLAQAMRRAEIDVRFERTGKRRDRRGIQLCIRGNLASEPSASPTEPPGLPGPDYADAKIQPLHDEPNPAADLI
jgi:hypothetical protein